MENKNSQVAARAAGARGGPGNRTPAKIPVAEIYNVRSYMFDIETRESLWLDRIGNPWSKDIALALEKLAVYSPKTAWLWISGDTVTLKLTENWKISISRDGTVIIRVPDCALVADDKFLLMCMDEDGYYTPVAKSEEITWDGTEEYFTTADVRRLVKETVKRVLERTQWL
jgi:hypothetical protein